MDSHLGVAPTSIRHAVLVEPQLERLFSRSDALRRHMEVAVRPYRLQVTTEAGGLQFAGDEVAVTLAKETIARIGSTHADEALIKDTLASVIQYALKHDLAYHLMGLSQTLSPASLSQVAFMNAMLSANRSLIFGVGPTGTGKTYLAVAAGLSLVAQSRFKRIIITRPHVRMQGEILAPDLGDDTAIDEQLTPIEDVLRDLVGREGIRHLSDQGLIEIILLGCMRGRTFKDSYIVIDHAHNMTVRKMRIAVTRLGRVSNMIVTGDPSQNDLPSGETSGLNHLPHLVGETDCALVHRVENSEIIRNGLVARIEALYSQDDSIGLRAAA